MIRHFVACLAAALLAAPAQAQFGGFLDKVKDRVQKGAQDEVGRQSEQKARGAVRDTMNPKDGAKKEAAPPQAQERAGAAKQGDREAQAAAQTPEPAAGEVYGNRYDFVPGDKVLVYDDFSDTDVGEYPAKWTIKDGGGNQVEVTEWQGRRFMQSRPQKDGQPSSRHWLRYVVNGDMPKKFTIEFDADVAAPFELLFTQATAWGGQFVRNHVYGHTLVTDNATGRMPFESGVHHFAVAVAGTQLKVYVDGERVVTDPDGVVRPIKRIGWEFGQEHDKERTAHQRFTAFRMAEGGKDAKTMLAGEGRIITHGILFDTGSDVLKPESGPTLRSIQTLLTDDAGLRFRVEGHTDDVGGPKVNGPLSERRAQAVKAWLVKQGIAEKRLEAQGLGATKPIDTNDTAEGRANNRRVEFVKLGVPAT